MKTNKLSGILMLPLSLALLFSGCASRPEREPLKVLAIGNSFSLSLLPHLPHVALALGEDLDFTSLYIGGCSLKRHVENLKKDDDFRPYQFNRVLRGKPEPQRKVSIGEILSGSVKYDIITVQQASHESWKPESYHPWGDELVAAIRKRQPQARILVQETWSYTPWDGRLKKWGIDQNEMYAKLKDAYAAFAAQYGFEEIRMGTAVQEWRRRLPVRYTENSFGGDVIGGRKMKPRDHFKWNADNNWVPNCDVFHLGDAGEYFQALVWAAKLFDTDVTECSYTPAGVSETDAKLMKEIATELR